MAYQQVTVAAITDIPAAVATFAAAHGWTVSGQNYRYGTGVQFTLSATITGYNHELKWTATSDARVTSSAAIRSPKLKGTATVPEVSIPSSVHLFTSATPQPFLAIVVEYGFNSYRHLYLGYLDKLGVFNGGEVISAANFLQPSQGSGTKTITYRDTPVQYLFGSHQQAYNNTACGGALVDHASNAVPWRTFYGPTGGGMGNILGTEVLGGFKDDINDAYIARGRSSYAGINLLVPINLYISQGLGSAANYAPIGNPAGVRSVHMLDLDPKSSILIASDEWMCFPALSKNVESLTQSANSWPPAETSSNIGYAYRKN